MERTKFLENQCDFPLQIKLSFEKVIDQLREKFEVLPHYQEAIQGYLEKIKDKPRLVEGLEYMEELEECKEEIHTILMTLFPYPLRKNEIKAASIPFVNIVFNKSDRFEKILKDAGPDYELTLKNYDTDQMYILGCTLILMFYYKYKINFKRPFFYDIPDANGMMRHYRVTYNADFTEIYPTEKAVDITDEDVAVLIDNFDNIDLWKEKFPPGSWVFKGFGLANLFDVTIDEALSSLKTNLLRAQPGTFLKIKNNIRSLYDLHDLEIGLTRYDLESESFFGIPSPEVKSILLKDKDREVKDQAMCSYLLHQVVSEHKYVAISDMDKYGERSNYNQFYTHLKDQGFMSYIIAPLVEDDGLMGVLEIASPNKRDLNSINAKKLEDVVPIFTMIMNRMGEEFKNKLELIIQEECTSIHPAVSWKFEQEAYRFYAEQMKEGSATFQEIVFEDVFPLYGQADISGSSTARNYAIQQDLTTQLKAAMDVIQEALEYKPLPIYQELVYRIDLCMKNIHNGMAAGSDQKALSFLKSEIYPVFEYVRSEYPHLEESVNNYLSMLDPHLQMVYDKRKDFDDTVTFINEHLAFFLDKKEVEAQNMFPHYFERYKTDGVEYNMYIGQSLMNNGKFDPIFLSNLKLWQLKTTCEMENEFNSFKSNLKTPLEIASLILAYTTPISIRFRMDEKRFDVDGAYNARYEIVKKRIDKSYIKGTNDRLTIPGKISIVYTQDSERIEYDKYIEYLQAINYVGENVEYLMLEDVQGITGLKAIRLDVVYREHSQEKVDWEYHEKALPNAE